MARRPRLLFAWELGANFGHVSKIAGLAEALSGAVDIWVAARDPVTLRRFAPGLACTLLPAPMAPLRPRPPPADLGQSYADDLRHVGYAGPETLGPLVEVWGTLLDQVAPDILVAQAAPTALIAARTSASRRGIATAVLGSGYDAPPRGAPMPRFDLGPPDPDGVVARREAEVLATINAALDSRRAPPIAGVADLLRTDAFLLATVPELDHYHPRARWESDPPSYLGQIYTADAGAELDWHAGDRPRILAYLRDPAPGTREILAALGGLARDAGADVILACPGLAGDVAGKLGAAGVRVVDGPVRLDRLLPGCTLGVSHGSNGVAAAFLMAGLPQIGLPGHAEQAMLIRALAEQGVATGIAGPPSAEACRDLLLRALAAPRMADKARAIAARYPGDSHRFQAGAAREAILRLVGAEPAPG